MDIDPPAGPSMPARPSSLPTGEKAQLLGRIAGLEERLERLERLLAQTTSKVESTSAVACKMWNAAPALWQPAGHSTTSEDELAKLMVGLLQEGASATKADDARPWTESQENAIMKAYTTLENRSPR